MKAQGSAFKLNKHNLRGINIRNCVKDRLANGSRLPARTTVAPLRHGHNGTVGILCADEESRKPPDRDTAKEAKEEPGCSRQQRLAARGTQPRRESFQLKSGLGCHSLFP
jgi:hypothetical protein